MPDTEHTMTVEVKVVADANGYYHVTIDGGYTHLQDALESADVYSDELLKTLPLSALHHLSFSICTSA